MEDGKYVVKPWHILVSELREDECDDSVLGTKYGVCYTKEMERNIPDSRIINIIDGKWCYMDVYGNHVNIEVSSNILLGPYFKYGEDCEVSDDNKAWGTVAFHYYTPGCMYALFTSQGAYKYVRRPVKKETYKPDIHTLLQDGWRVVQSDNGIKLYHKGVIKFDGLYDPPNRKPPDNALHIPEGFEPAYNKNGDLIGCFGSIDGSYLGYYL